MVVAQNADPGSSLNVENPNTTAGRYGILFKLVERSNDNFPKIIGHKSYPHCGGQNPYQQERT